MGHLHSVLLCDAGWITALLAGIIIESRLSQPFRRRRGAVSESPHGWLSADRCASLVKHTESPLPPNR